MEQKHDPDGIGTVAQLAALQQKDTLAVKELEVATKLCQSALQASADSYEQLLTQFVALKETAQAGAKGHEQTAELEEAQKYVLILIDAHSHTFADAFLCGEASADVVENIIKNILERRHPELATLTIAAKVYADFEKLSTQVSLEHKGERMKVVQALTQKFSSANPRFDFVNVSHNALVEKIIAMFLWHNEDPRCAHILLSTTVHNDYDEMLSKHPDYRNKITDIPTAMADDLGETVKAVGEAKAAVSHSREESNTPVASSSKAVVAGKVGLPQIQGQYGHFENDRYVPCTPPNSGVEVSNVTIRQRQDSRSPPGGLIPINAAGHRIDAPLRPPTKEEHIKFKQRTKQKNLCTAFHLTGHCSVNHCRYDHSSITLPILHVLKHKIRGWPCTAGGGCRCADCFHGHVCLAKGCSGRRQPGCKFSLESHGVDLKIVKQVKPGIVEEFEVIEVEIPAGPYGKATNEEMKDKSWFKTGDSKASMENWPTMVGDLIEI